MLVPIIIIIENIFCEKTLYCGMLVTLYIIILYIV